MVLAMMEDVKLFIVSKQKAPYVALCFHYRHIITAQLQLQQLALCKPKVFPLSRSCSSGIWSEILLKNSSWLWELVLVSALFPFPTGTCKVMEKRRK